MRQLLCRRFFRRLGLRFLVLSVCAGCPCVDSASASEIHELWRYETREEIRFLDSAGSTTIIVGTKKEVVSLDVGTGRVSWIRDDVGELQEYNVHVLPSKSYIAVRTSKRTGIGLGKKKRLVVLDTRNGRTIWDSAEQDEIDVHRYLELSETGYFLVYGEAKNDGRAGFGVHLVSGERAWRQDDLFRVYPRRWSNRRDLVHQLFPPVSIDEDVILYAGEDGPLRLRAKTGEVAWHTDSLDWTEPRSMMRLSDGVVYVPSGKTITALDAETGVPTWRYSGEVPGDFWMVFETDHGLVARGDSFIDLLDKSKGTSRWEEPIVRLKHNMFLKAGDELIFTMEDYFGTIDLVTGARANLRRLDFFEEHAQRMQRLDDWGYVLLSPEDIALLSPDGEVKYHRHYDAPGVGILRSIYRSVDSYFTNLDHENEQSATTPRYHLRA